MTKNIKKAAAALAVVMTMTTMGAMAVTANAQEVTTTRPAVTAEVSQEYKMQPGDVFVTNCAIADGLFGHAAIAISPDTILHIGGPGQNPSVMSLAEWNAHYSSKANTWTKVYRLSDSKKAADAARWAEKTYFNSKAKYKIFFNKASTDCTYCSKLVWQAFYYGAFEHESEAYNFGWVTPYELEGELGLDLVHTFKAPAESAAASSSPSFLDSLISAIAG